MEIVEIGNYYGGLDVEEVNDKYFWWIEGVSPADKEEIPKYLYDALVKFQKDSHKEDL